MIILSITKSMKVLIAVDPSKTAEKAFDFYMENLHSPRHKVFVLYLVDQPTLPFEAYKHPDIFKEEIHDIYVQHDTHIAEMKKIYFLKCKAIQELEFEVIVDTVSAGVDMSIVKKANELQVGLVVMGTRGHGLIRRTILGSISNFVLHHSNVPTLLCHK